MPMFGRVVACLCLAVAAPGQVPPGYKTYENKLAPLTFFYPVAFQELPLPPTEQVDVAKFLLEKVPEELEPVDKGLLKAFRPELVVFRFESETTVPETGALPAQAPLDTGPANVKQAMEAKSRVGSWQQFTSRFEQWEITVDAQDPDLFRLQWREGAVDDHLPIGYLKRRQEGNTTFGVYGFTLAPNESRFRKQFARMAASLELASEDRGGYAEAALDRLYANGKFRGVEARKAARRALARGWKALDTENYLIVHHTRSPALIKRIAREIEAMRAFYTELFPPTGPMDKVCVVRVCRTLEEYQQYGGPPNTGGYWHPGNEELVFFDYSYTQKTFDDEAKQRLGKNELTDEDSLLVLHHEAFHQYIHYAIGEFSPHDWFNEGYGDYFSGVVLSPHTSKVQRVDPAAWRIHMAKDMCEYGDDFVPLERLLKANRAEFYHPKRIANYYAGAWSFVYFLEQSEEARAHPRWSKLLDTYFTKVKDVYEDEIRRLGDDVDLGQKIVAGAAARTAALDAALEGIDLDELERAWKQWVVDMKDPWPHLRKKREQLCGG